MELPVVVLLAACFVYLNVIAQRRGPLGATAGRLAPCSPAPNGVSSQADPDDGPHYIEPLRLTGTPEDALARLKTIVLALPRSTIVREGPGYLHAELRGPLLPLRHDVELSANPATGVIDLRAAARVGYADLGFNRRRMEHLRQQFTAGST